MGIELRERRRKEQDAGETMDENQPGKQWVHLGQRSGIVGGAASPSP
jgi:hypothetical protein